MIGKNGGQFLSSTTTPAEKQNGGKVDHPQKKFRQSFQTNKQARLSSNNAHF